MKMFIIILLQLTWYLTITQQESIFLSMSGECGYLKEQHFYNPERISVDDEFPWIGQLKFKTSATGLEVVEYKGIAVLISRRHLLANGQLFYDVKHYENISVVLGTSDTESLDQMEYKIDGVSIHPNFTGNSSNSQVFHNDIAVIRLRKDAIFNAKVQAICLPTTDIDKDNTVAHYLPFAGFPASSADGTKKIKISGRIISAKSCGRYKSINLSDGQMCAFSSDKVVPLRIGSVLMGVVVENSEPQYYYMIGLLSLSGVERSSFAPDILVKIVHFVNWIEFMMI